MAVRRVKRKKFECGHRGFGQFCHRCQQADGARKEALYCMARGDDVKAREKGTALFAEANRLEAA